MELVTRRDISKFCSTPQKITRDGTGAYLYRAEPQDVATYYNGKLYSCAVILLFYHCNRLQRLAARRGTSKRLCRHA